MPRRPAGPPRNPQPVVNQLVVTNTGMPAEWADKRPFRESSMATQFSGAIPNLLTCQQVNIRCRLFCGDDVAGQHRESFCGGLSHGMDQDSLHRWLAEVDATANFQPAARAASAMLLIPDRGGIAPDEMICW